MSGLYYAQARYYAPQAARFTSEDLIKGSTSLPQSFNQYAYCWNQPINYVDLDGLWPQWIRDAGNWVSDQASNAWDVTTNFWNTHIYGERTVYVHTTGRIDGIAGGYVTGSRSETVQNPERTGSIIVRTTTITTGSSVQHSEGISLNIPGIASLGGSVGSSSGLQLNGSLGINANGYGVRINGNVGLGGSSWVNAGVNARVGWDNNWYGAGAYLPVSPFESARLFGFNERVNSNVSYYSEAGIHLRMGGLYAVATTIIAAIIIAKSLGTATGPVGSGAAALIALLLGTNIDSTSAQCEI